MTILREADIPAAPLSGDQVVQDVLARQVGVEPARAPGGLLLDAGLGDGPYAVDTVAALASAVPGLGIVVVIGRPGGTGLLDVLEAGARALIHRQCTPEELVAAVRSALDGTNWVSGPLAGPVRAELLAESSEGRGDALTPREVDVLRGLARGRTNAAIGTSLGISEHTVRNHVHAVLRKLRVANRTDAVATAVRRGLVDLAD